jgi:spoIIIJ-associated protein
VDREPRGNRERASKPEAGRADEVDQVDQVEPAAGPSGGSVTGELGEIGQFTLGTIERMGLGPFEISESKDGEMIVLQVKGPAGQMLSSGHGRTVDALQLLVNQVSARLSPDRQRVVIDVEGDADARAEFLGKLADRVAKRALQTGRPVALDPMNGRDRRLIHVALRDREDVATMSEGEGRYRQVVVVPESSDEFEDARAKSERAGSNN